MYIAKKKNQFEYMWNLENILYANCIDDITGYYKSQY